MCAVQLTIQHRRLGWLEEPLHPEDVMGYARLCERSPLPIATGEAESRYTDFERLLVDGLIDWAVSVLFVTCLRENRQDYYSI